MIKNILWDVDGTLFDTYPAITYAISKTLNDMGLSVALNIIDTLARQSLDHCMDTLSRRFKLDLNALRQKFAVSYEAIPPAKHSPFPGVSHLCAFICDQGGVNIIVTHRSMESTQQLLDAHGFAHFFAGIFSVAQGYPRKPDPAMLEAAIQEFRLKRSETLMIGDRELDIQAGHATGIRSCLFGQAQFASHADFQIDHYSQLLSLLQETDQ